ncbi:DUF4864 domain-containing protein [Pontibacter ruber]|uniref:DUF4864 domain-containing protein n=1 Tax=Pontibacter ruber TaxID=1343895 RepID=A0ABW5D292_9BACT|nr:DUF4864 domain-containing protein [Pontibacter ruber]
MRGYERLYDKLLLMVGVVLLVLLWVQFPAQPTQDMQVKAVYATSETGAEALSKSSFLRPSKALSPRQVIRIQLRALQQNDHSDSGVITVFNFSSPTNRVTLGPINHFRLLVRDPAYSPMLNFKSYKTGKLIITENSAYQLVVVKGQDDTESAYLFILGRQQKGPYKGCWMTEGVARMDAQRESSLI